MAGGFAFPSLYKNTEKPLVFILGLQMLERLEDG